MQRIIFEQVEAPITSPSEKANLARAYCAWEEMKRVLTMRPAPKPIDVNHRNTKTIAPATFTEPATTILSIENGSDMVSVEPPQNKKP